MKTHFPNSYYFFHSIRFRFHVAHTHTQTANSSDVPILNIPVEFETDGTFRNVQRSETFQPEGKRFFFRS